MRPADAKRLMDAMAAAGVLELELEQRDDAGLVARIRLVRGSSEAAAGAAALAAGQPAHASGPTSAAAASGPAAAVSGGGPLPDAEPVTATRLVDVVAPIVGTFYASPSPDANAYVKVGDRVQMGSVLCIIEAMKLMNEIEAEVAGTVAEVLVTDEDPVEYGQVLFRIDPS